MSDIDESGKRRDGVAETSRPATPRLERGTPLPEEWTGRASATGEDLTALFDNDTAGHFTDSKSLTTAGP
jgi:hypothetical protein